MRDLGDVGELVVADADLEVGLEHQGGDQRHQVGIAAALAQAVQGALGLARTGPEGGQGVGHGVLGVVVGVDAQVAARDPFGHLGHDGLHLMG